MISLRGRNARKSAALGLRTAKILCVGNWPSDIGYAWWLMERFWEGIARLYPGQVTICWPTLNEVPERLRDCGAEFVEFAFDVENRDSIDFLTERGITHVYLTDKPYVSFAYGLMRRAGVQRIIMHDHMPGQRSEPKGIKRALKLLAGRIHAVTADAYIAVSALGMRRFARSCCLPASRCHLATNGIDLTVEAKPVDIRAELDLPADAVVIVSSSRATIHKGVQHIIEAARHVDAQFVHVGDGPHLEEFRSVAPHNFHLIGKRSDVPGILASADIAVHGSGNEGLSLSVLEFMRAGLPIVLPDTPTASQTVKDGVSALLYPVGDAEVLAARLRSLVARPALRHALGAEAKRQVQRYNVDNTVRDVIGVFRALEV